MILISQQGCVADTLKATTKNSIFFTFHINEEKAQKRERYRAQDYLLIIY